MITHRNIVSEEVRKLLDMETFDRVLEIGAGFNSFESFFDCIEYIKVDNESQYIGDSIKMDAHNLDFKDNEFDCVFMCHVAEHFVNPIKAFSEIHRVLKKESSLISITPFPCEHQILNGDSDHFFVLNPMQYIRLLKSIGFKRVKSYIQMTYQGEQINKVQDYNIITVAKK